MHLKWTTSEIYLKGTTFVILCSDYSWCGQPKDSLPTQWNALESCNSFKFSVFNAQSNATVMQCNLNAGQCNVIERSVVKCNSVHNCADEEGSSLTYICLLQPALWF